MGELDKIISDLKEKAKTEVSDYFSNQDIEFYFPKIEVNVDNNSELPPMIDPSGYGDIDVGEFKYEQEISEDLDVLEYDSSRSDEIYEEEPENRFEEDQQTNEGVSARGMYIPGGSEKPDCVKVNLAPFDLREYDTFADQTVYEQWVEDSLGGDPSESLKQIDSSKIQAGDTEHEKLFYTIQRNAEVGELSGSLEEIYERILENNYDSLTSTLAHETTHHCFSQSFDYEIPDLSREELRSVLEELDQHQTAYETVNNGFTDSWVETIEQVADKDRAEQFEKVSKLEGINEVYSRIVQRGFEGGEISELDRDDLYDHNRFYTETSYEMSTPNDEGIGFPAKLSDVKVDKLMSYMDNEGFGAVLNLSEDKLIKKFYDE